MEKEARQKELRKKDRDAQQARVSVSLLQFYITIALVRYWVALNPHPTLKLSSFPAWHLLFSLPIGSCKAYTDLFSQRKEEARVAKEHKDKAYQRDHAYDDLFSEENMAAASNQDRSEDFLDDFF